MRLTPGRDVRNIETARWMLETASAHTHPDALVWAGRILSLEIDRMDTLKADTRDVSDRYARLLEDYAALQQENARLNAQLLVAREKKK